MLCRCCGHHDGHQLQGSAPSPRPWPVSFVNSTRTHSTRPSLVSQLNLATSRPLRWPPRPHSSLPGSLPVSLTVARPSRPPTATRTSITPAPFAQPTSQPAHPASFGLSVASLSFSLVAAASGGQPSSSGPGEWRLNRRRIPQTERAIQLDHSCLTEDSNDYIHTTTASIMIAYQGLTVSQSCARTRWMASQQD